MKPHKLTTRLLGIIMSFMMLIGSAPGMQLAALAADDDTGTTTDSGSSADTTTLAQSIISDLGLDVSPDEYEDDNDPATYNVWIGDVRITETNKNDVLGDGKVSFDPESHTLTLNDAVLDKISTEDGGAPSTSANICARETLVIKGSARLTNAHSAIVSGISSFIGNKNRSLTIDADLEIDAVNSGIYTVFIPLYIDGGNITIKSGSIGILGTYGDIEAKGGKLNLTGAMIGIMSATSLIINGAAIEAEGSEGAIMANPAPDSTIEIYSPSFIEEPSGTAIAPVMIEGRNGQAIVDSNGDPVKKIKIGAKSGVEKVTVSYDLNGHGLGTIPPRVIGKGDKVCMPPEPVDNGFAFAGWYTEAACTNKYDFNTEVNADMTLYANWTDISVWPDPIYGSGSALDPLPTIIPGTTKDLYLVKGQKFTIGSGWRSSDSKTVSISKKGELSVKKDGETSISCGEGDNTYSINIHAVKPDIAKKIKLDTGSKTSEQIMTGLPDDLPVIFYSASPDVATVDDSGMVTAVGKGSAKVTAYINGKAYSSTVSVKESVTAKNRTMHLAVGSSKSISIKGIKKWESASKDIAEMNKKGKKVTAKAPGETVLSASANNTEYTIDFYAEDITIGGEGISADGKPSKNKYKLKLNKGGETDIEFSESLMQEVIFNSNKPDIAFVDEEGHITARDKGSCKLSAKVDGKTITISVKVE